jgi:hypothetical protein
MQLIEEDDDWNCLVCKIDNSIFVNNSDFLIEFHEGLYITNCCFINNDKSEGKLFLTRFLSLVNCSIDEENISRVLQTEKCEWVCGDETDDESEDECWDCWNYNYKLSTESLTLEYTGNCGFLTFQVGPNETVFEDYNENEDDLSSIIAYNKGLSIILLILLIINE